MQNRSAYKHYYLMLLPGLLWLCFFNLLPMYGIVIAIKDFNPGYRILRSDWIGLEQFKNMCEVDDSKQVFKNTIFIAVMKMIRNLIVPKVFAVILNEEKNRLITRRV